MADNADDGPESLMSIKSNYESDYLSKLSIDHLSRTVIVKDIDVKSMGGVVRALRVTKPVESFNKDVEGKLLHIVFVQKTDADNLLRRGAVPYGDMSYPVSKAEGAVPYGDMSYLVSKPDPESDLPLTSYTPEIPAHRYPFTQPLPPHKLAMLQSKPFLELIERNHHGIVVVVTPSQICVHAVQKEVGNKVYLSILEHLTQLDSEMLQVPDTVLTLLQSEDGKEYVDNYISVKSIKITYSCMNGRLNICALNSDDMNSARILFQKTFAECRISGIDRQSSVASQSPKWSSFVSELKKAFKPMVVEVVNGAGAENSTGVAQDQNADKMCVLLGCLESVSQDVVAKINKFIEENDAETKFIEMNKDEMEIITSCAKDEIVRLENNLTSQGGTFHQGSNISGKSGFTVSGNRRAVVEIERELEKLRRAVIQKEHTFDRQPPGISKYFTSTDGINFLRDVARDSKVVIKVEVKAEDDQHKVKIPETKHMYEFPANKLTLKVSHGNILLCPGIDGLVNPSSTELDLSRSKLGQALIVEAGASVQEECKKHVRKTGQLLPKQVFKSGAGNLRSIKCIFHAVGPNSVSGAARLENVEYFGVISACIEAGSTSCTKLAIPLTFDYSATKAAETIWKILREFPVTPQTTLTEVHVLDDRMMEVRRFLLTIKQLENGGSRLVGDPGGARPPFVFRTTNGSPSVNVPKPPSRFHNTGVRNQLKTSEGIIVTLVFGAIERLPCKVEVIVNTTSQTLQLGQKPGAVSTAILNVAGQQIQNEVSTVAPGGIKPGSTPINSHGYKLQCDYVYHGSAIPWDPKPGSKSEEILRQFISGCFLKAHNEGRKSLAMPAIGSGNLGTPVDIVANVMFDELLKFSSKKSPSPLKEIYFVAHDKNAASVAAFQRKMSALEADARAADNDDTAVMASLRHWQSLSSTVRKNKRPFNTQTSSLCLRVSALSQTSIDITVAKVKRKLDDIIIEKNIGSDAQDQKAIKNLTPDQTEAIEGLQSDHSIQIRLRQDIGVICVKGLHNNVHTAAVDIIEILKEPAED